MGGIALSGIAVYAVRLSERQQRRVPPPQPDPAALPEGTADVLAVLRSSGIVLDEADSVVNNSPAAVANGLVRGQDLTQPELLALARQVRRDGVIREVEIELPKGPAGRPGLVVGARVAPLGSSHVLLLVEDLSQARRLEEIRRDFVANVSHELKTPVGGLARLAAEEKGIDIALAASGDCFVWGDHALLVTAIRNLVGNAVAYSERHTRVAVGVRPLDGDLVELAVTDQGHGIAMADQQRIFE